VRTVAASDALTDAYMAATASVRARVLEYARQMWAGSESLRDADVARLVSRIVPIVQAGQIQVANLTNAYILRLAVLEGVVAEAASIDRAAILDYRGVPADDVYRRPAVTTYTSLGDGTAFAVAKDQGLARLLSIASTDLQQARNRQATAAYGSTGFEYTERVLSGAENCALCVIASTQRYRKRVLMPIHPGCDCGQRGVKAETDPGQVIKRDLLELTHAQIDAKLGGTDRGARILGREKVTSAGNPISDYTDLVISNQHGELGPTLAWRSDHFTGPADIH
jgi:hypothetical protein